MDLADDIAYSVHDVEDGVVAGRIDLAALADAGLRREVWSTVEEWYLPEVDAAELDAALERLSGSRVGQVGWPRASYDGSRAALADLKNLTSLLIGRFCRAATAATHDRFGSSPLTRYEAELIVPHETQMEISVLKGVAAHLVMRAEDRVGVLDRERQVVAELVEALWRDAPSSLEQQFADDFAVASDDTARVRVVTDQVASLTDGSALVWHERLCRGSGVRAGA
jgi:dGTPase